MLAILLSQIMGLVRGILVARAFGASAELDAFLAANRVSETLFLLVAGGALGSAFIPTFTSLLAKKDTFSAWKLASAIANLITIVLGLLAVGAAVFAPQIVRYGLAPGFSNDPGLFSLTVSLLRIQLISTLFFGLGGLMVGILNANQIFLIPALTPAMYQLGIIFGCLFLTPSLGVHGLAWGVVIGSILYLALQIPSLFRLPDGSDNQSEKSKKYNLSFGINQPEVREVIILMGPRLLGVAIVQLNFWVNTWLASQMSVGSVTGLYYGFSMMLMAQAVIAQSVAIAAMPTFSAQFALGRTDDMRSSLALSLRSVILLAVPASLGLILLRQPLVSLLYERGEFDQYSVQLVAWALLWFSSGLVGHAIMEVLTRAFYARHDTRTPVIVGTLAMLLNVILSVAFSRLFERVGWLPLGGLALANSLATALEASALFALMRVRLQGIEGIRILRGFGASGLAALGMAAGLMLWQRWTAQHAAWLTATGGVTLGGFIYFLGLWLLRIPETRLITDNLRRRMTSR